MADASAESNVTSNMEDIPELSARLRYLDHERLRCLEYAAKLSGWAMFWKIMLISLGALVAAQGAFVNIWGQAHWVTITFILFGVLIALASGCDLFFRPAERSPKFAQIGFEYERLGRELSVDRTSLLRQAAKYGSLAPNEALQKAIEKVARQSDTRLDVLREKELTLYVTGPAKWGYAKNGREKLWRRFT